MIMETKYKSINNNVLPDSCLLLLLERNLPFIDMGVGNIQTNQLHCSTQLTTQPTHSFFSLTSEEMLAH